MNEVVYKNALYEVYEILTYINEQSRNKIPNKLIEYIKENKSVEYEFEINKNITIEKQKLLPETEAFITIIYRDYICPKDKRDELDKIMNTIDILVREVPVYRLKCNMETEAAEVAYNGMKGNTDNEN